MRAVYFLMLSPCFACFSGGGSEEPPRDPDDPSRILRQAGDDPVAARVNGAVIRRSALEERVQAQVGQFRQAGRPITDAFVHSTRKALLNHLIDRALISAEGTRLKLTVEADELKHQETLFRERLGTQEAFDGYLARINRDLAGWQDDQRQHLLRRKVFERSAVAKPVDEAALRASYEKQKSRYARQRRLRLGEILKRVPTDTVMPDKTKRDAEMAKAKRAVEGLVKRAQTPGVRFSQLAMKHSDSPSKARGGDLGWRTQTNLAPLWATQLKDAKKNAVVGPIQSPDGMRLLKVIDVEEARQLTFEDVREELRRELNHRARASAERALVASLRAKATILIEDHRLKDEFKAKKASAKP